MQCNQCLFFKPLNLIKFKLFCSTVNFQNYLDKLFLFYINNKLYELCSEKNKKCCLLYCVVNCPEERSHGSRRYITIKIKR